MERYISVFLKVFVYTNIYISFCAFMMAWELYHVFSLSQNNLPVFIFWASFCTYHFHALVNTYHTGTSLRHEWNVSHTGLIILSIFLSALLSIYYGWPLRSHIFPLALAALASFLYSAPNIPYPPFIQLRKIAIGKTIFLAGVWTYVTGLLPLLLADISLRGRHFAFLFSRLFLVYAICILFDRRDVEEDRVKGIRALPTMLSEAATKKLYYASLSLSVVSSLSSIVYGIPTITVIALIVPALILFFLFGYSGRHRGEFLYTVVLDGMMMFSALVQAISLISFTFVTR